MDQCTHEVQLHHWKNIICQYQRRPKGRWQNNGWMKMFSGRFPAAMEASDKHDGAPDRKRRKAIWQKKQREREVALFKFSLIAPVVAGTFI